MERVLFFNRSTVLGMGRPATRPYGSSSSTVSKNTLYSQIRSRKEFGQPSFSLSFETLRGVSPLEDQPIRPETKARPAGVILFLLARPKRRHSRGWL